MPDTKLLWRLTGAHLKRPDPPSWLVAADHLEEYGDGRASLWRRRGLYYPTLRRLFDEVAVIDPAVCGHRPFYPAFGRPTNERFREIRLGSVIVSMWKQRVRHGRGHHDDSIVAHILRPDRTWVRSYLLDGPLIWESRRVRRRLRVAYIDLRVRRRLLRFIDEHGHDFDEEARP
jgi:hypothetical protein